MLSNFTEENIGIEVEFEMTVGAIGPAKVVGLIVGLTFGFP